MPSQVLIASGTTLTWLASGGDRVLTLTSLASGAARQGGGYDFGADFPPEIYIEAETKFAVAPTTFQPLNVYWASSLNGTLYSGVLGSADAAVSDLDVLAHLHFVGVLAANNVTTQQVVGWVFSLPTRYGLPVVYNNTSQALSSTAGDHAIRVMTRTPEAQ